MAKDKWLFCDHAFRQFWGPVLTCLHCGASTMATMDRNESKPIMPPHKYMGEEPRNG